MKMHHARVKDILTIYRSSGIGSVKKYLDDENVIISEGTWEHKIKKLLDQNLVASTEAEIASLSYIFNLSTELYGRNSSYESDDQGSEDRGDSPD